VTSPLYWVAVAAAPAAVLMSGRRLASRSRGALIVTALATWVLATGVMEWFVPDPSFIYPVLLFFFVIVPVVGSIAAAVIATRLVPTRGRLISALLLALLGWIAALVVGAWLDMNAHAAGRYLWDYAEALALPASWSASAAVVAAGVRS
jgi:hypothetical protein